MQEKKIKQKFNLYCVIMLLVIVGGLSYDIMDGAEEVINAFSDGWSTSKTNKKEHSDQKTEITYTSLHALDNNYYDYSIVNNKTSQKEPMQLMTVKVKTTQKQPSCFWMNLLGGVSSLTFLIAMVLFWIHFIKLILAVNRGLAFDRIIERRLRLIGWLLLTVYLAEWGIELFFYYINYNLVDVSRYKVVMVDHPSMMTLLAGIGMLLVSQIFAIGRQMKEEQELTI